MKELVSICIPAYKEPLLLRKAIESVLIQSFTNYEIVVSDDTPDDSVQEIIKEFEEPKISYFKNKIPLGSPGNWNNAVMYAKGKYIKILHHDDYFTNAESLQKFVSVMEANPKTDFVFSNSNIYFKRTNEHYLHKQTSAQLKRLSRGPEFLYFRNCIGAPSAVMFKKDNSILFDESYKWLVDVEFYINYLRKHETFKSIPEPLVTILDGADGQITKEVSMNGELVINENLRLFSRIYHPNLNTKKSWLFFQELFSMFEIESYQMLCQDFVVPTNIDAFLKEVFEDVSKNRLVKKIKKRLVTSRYNKRIFKLERF